MERKTLIITQPEQLDEVFERYYQADFIAVDTETNGLHRFCECVGVSFSISSMEGIYIPIKIFENGELFCPWDDAALQEVKDFVITLLSRSKRLILHNSCFDAKVFNNWLGYGIMPNVFCDTVLLAHTVHNEEGPLGLKELAAELIDPEAKNPRDAVKLSVKANGGKVSQNNFEMYKCNYEILGSYAAYDTIYTYALFERLYPEIKKQGLEDLWENEVMALLPLVERLNNQGVPVDVAYFEKLKREVTQKIEQIESDIYAAIADQVADYEYARILEEVKITPRSALGKLLYVKYCPNAGDILDVDREDVQQDILSWYKEKNRISRIFNLDSNDDKAHLIFNVLGLPCEKKTASGKQSTDAATLEKLCEEYKDEAPILQKLLDRAGERKILSTYVESVLEAQIDGKIYTGFKQHGTTSGRFSSGNPINLQNLPRDDKRIKKGFVSAKGWSIVASDSSSLEPHIFSVVSGEEKIKKIFRDDLDFYSQIAIDMFNMSGVSARESDANFLKKVDPEKRQLIKAMALAVPYGVMKARLAKLLGCDKEQAQDYIDLYLATYPALAKWMTDSEFKAITKGYVVSLAGRKRRFNLVHEVYKRFRITNFDYKKLRKVYSADSFGFETYDDFYYACKNQLNLAKNHQIQSLGASYINAAMIEFNRALKANKLSGYMLAQVHDEIIATCPDNEIEITAKLLQKCMENNRISKFIDVPMKAEPAIGKNWSEAK